MSRSEKMYKDSPKLERGEDGNMGVKKPSPADAENMGTAGGAIPGTPGEMPVQAHQAHERREMHHKHAHEHLQMHSRHELDHAGHKEGDKSEMHKRHEEELKGMHEKHHKEMKSMHEAHNKTGEGMINKVEKNKKEGE